MNQPNIGDVVQLNSGGPALTVTHYGARDGVFVVWINQDGVAQTTSFPLPCLKKYAKQDDTTEFARGY